MQDPPVLGRGEPRWEYKILWRYGPLSLAFTGLAMLGFGISGIGGTTVSLALLPLGFICFIAGVALPRIEGIFTAGPRGISGRMLPVHELDTTYTVTGSALAPQADAVVHGETATVPAEGQPSEPVRLGDVWDALDAAGFRPTQAALGTAFLDGPDGRSISLPNRGFLDWRPAADDLVVLLAAWGARPAASGKYQVPPNLHPSKATTPISAKPEG